MTERMICSSCGLDLLGDDKFVKFLCPSCVEQTILRCSKCKRLSNGYTCSKCGFLGP